MMNREEEEYPTPNKEVRMMNGRKKNIQHTTRK
jgi:hypothetical protein